MKIDESKLKKICKLAKIEIKDDEISKYIDLINADLEILEDIDKVDVSNIEPLTNPYDMKLNRFEDKVNDGNIVDDLMKSAPKELYNYFIVPKVIEK